ncbi:MAG: hypothetical protein V8T12_04505 [Parabacteroides johnsonii]
MTVADLEIWGSIKSIWNTDQADHTSPLKWKLMLRNNIRTPSVLGVLYHLHVCDLAWTIALGEDFGYLSTYRQTEVSEEFCMDIPDRKELH